VLGPETGIGDVGEDVEREQRPGEREEDDETADARPDESSPQPPCRREDCEVGGEREVEQDAVDGALEREAVAEGTQDPARRVAGGTGDELGPGRRERYRERRQREQRRRAGERRRA